MRALLRRPEKYTQLYILAAFLTAFRGGHVHLGLPDCTSSAGGRANIYTDKIRQDNTLLHKDKDSSTGHLFFSFSFFFLFFNNLSLMTNTATH